MRCTEISRGRKVRGKSRFAMVILGFFVVAISPSWGQSSDSIQQWYRWQHSLTSTVDYVGTSGNPYRYLFTALRRPALGHPGDGTPVEG